MGGYLNGRLAIRFFALLTFFASANVGCTLNDDFGRTKPSLVYSEISHYTASVASVLDDKEPRFTLTADEIELRKSASHFHNKLPEPLFVKTLHSGRATYADHLSHAGHMSGETRLQAIAERLKADHYWLDRLARAARTVLRADATRQGVLATNHEDYTERDRARIRGRIKENRAVIRAVFRVLGERIAFYGQALDRTLIETPGTSLREAEVSLSLLRERKVFLQGEFSRMVNPANMADTLSAEYQAPIKYSEKSSETSEHPMVLQPRKPYMDETTTFK